MCTINDFEIISRAVAPWIFGALGIWVALQQIAIAKTQADIAASQAKFAELNTRIALFNKRYELFNKTVKFINQLMIDGSDPEKCQLFTRDFAEVVVEARFLFDTKMRDFLESIQNVEGELWVINKEIQLSPVGSPELNDNAIARSKQIKWLRDTLNLLEEKFHPYLSLD